MSSAKHNLLLQACHSGLATTSECEQLSYAAGMWACGEHKITRAEVTLAETILKRSMASTASQKDELAEYTQEPADPAIYGEQYRGSIKLTVTSGQNAGRQFMVTKTKDGYLRGLRLFPSLAAAAGGYIP